MLIRLYHSFLFRMILRLFTTIEYMAVERAVGRVNYGTGVIVTDLEGRNILVAEQEKGKGEIRKVGQDSIPLETAKIITSTLKDVDLSDSPKLRLENQIDTLYGAMGEVANDATLDTIGRDSFHVAPIERFLPSEVHPGVFVKVDVVVFSGDTASPLSSAHPEEIGAVRWVDPADFLAGDDSISRPLAKEVVLYALENDLIGRALSEHAAGNTGRLFEENFSMDAFYVQREQERDIKEVYSV